MKTTSFPTTVLWSSTVISDDVFKKAQSAVLKGARDVDDAKILFNILGLINDVQDVS